jgi:DNA-binding response OmpR family regulator
VPHLPEDGLSTDKGDAISMIISYENIAQFRQQEQPVSVCDVCWDAEQRTIVIGDMTVTLTPVQYHLLLPLQHGTPVTYASLARHAYGCAIDKKVRKMIDKHIDRIRDKLRGTGVYIYCVLNYGYVLLNEIMPEENGGI